MPSPASTIESLTRELEHSLDIHSATKGQYVVKPQDEDKSKAEGPSKEELKKLLLNQEFKNFIDRSQLNNGSQTTLVPCNSNSIGRTSINSANGLRYENDDGFRLKTHLMNEICIFF